MSAILLVIAEAGVAYGQTDYIPGELYIKFSEAGLNKISGMTPLSEALSRLGASDIRQAFPIPPNRGSMKISAEAGRRLDSLAHIRRVSFPENLDMEYVAKKLSALPDIDYAEPVYTYKLFATPNDPAYISSRQEYLDFISAPQAWDIAHGDSTVVVAIVDSGVDWNHPDLRNNLWTNAGEIPGNGLDDDVNGFIDDVNGWDFYGSGTAKLMAGDNDPTSTTEPHGTHVAGIAAAVTDNGIGVASLSWNVRYMPVKTSSDTGEEIVAGFEGITYAASNGADIINLSWGSPQYSQASGDVIAYAVSMGSLIVASAGNDGNDRDMYPASYPNVLSVASVDLNGEKSEFSNYGTKVDVAAPGNPIYSTVLGNTYDLMAGTSMSAPLVSSLAALIKSAHPDWDADQIQAQITGTATPLSVSNPYQYLCGCGYINAAKALGERVLNIDIVDFRFSDEHGNGDGLFSPGETIDAEVTIRNSGEPVSNVSVSLVSLTGFTTPLVSTIALPSLDHKETKILDTISFAVNTTVSPDVREFVRLEFANPSGSINFGVIDALVNPSYGTFTANTIEVSFDNKGHIGFVNFPDNTRGSGLIIRDDTSVEHGVYNIPLLFEGGLMFGNTRSRISNCVRGAQLGISDDEFVVIDPFTFLNSGDGISEVGTVGFSDTGAGPESYGVTVTLKSTEYSDMGNNQYILLEYTFTNTGDTSIQDFRAGLFLDFDIPEPDGLNDYGYYAAEDDMVVFAADSDIQDDSFLVGVALAESIDTPFLIENSGTDNISFSIYDGFSDSEKWQSLTAGKQGAQSTGPGDLSLVLSPAAFALKPGESHTVTFILAYGLGYENLRDQISNARTRAESGGPTGIALSSGSPLTFAIFPAYPNPFNPSTTIGISLPEDEVITVDVYDVLGRRVKTLYSGFAAAGEHRYLFDARGMASGLYFIRLKTVSGRTAFTKITMIR